VNEADLLVHLVDSSAPEPEGQIDAVRGVLAEIGASSVPEVLVFNKADVAPREAKELAVRFEGEGPVVISARTGDGVGGLVEAVAERLRAASRVVELVVPYDRGDVLAALHREGEVLSSAQGTGATRVRARLDRATVARFAKFEPAGDGPGNAVPDDGEPGEEP
jgi:GTP-binding protein HflX